MLTSSLLAVSFGMKVVAGLFIICSILLILIILVQKGKGGGLSAAFGGGGGGGGVLGTKTGDFLTWVTIGLVVVWFFLAIVMAKFYKPDVGEYETATPPGTETAAPAQPETAPGAPAAPNEVTN